MKMFQWLDNCAESFRKLCERRWFLFLSAVSLVYLAVTSALAWRQPMWNDEMFTYFIAKSPTLSDIWSALLTGADQNPVPYYLLTRWSLAVFGDNEWALRLPVIIGVLLAGLCLFHIVARRTEKLYGFIAMAFLFVTGANFYSFQGRPYGLVLGFAALAWVFWLDATTAERSRSLHVLGFAVSLTAAVCSHYYAVFVLIPLGVGELLRSIERRRVDWPIWIAMIIALAPLLWLLPTIQQAKAYSQGFWARPSLQMLPEAYFVLLMPTPLVAVAALILGGVYSLTHPTETQSQIARRNTPAPLHEIAVAMGFAALPIIEIVTTALTTGAFTYRYALPTVLGITVLSAIAVARLFQGRPTFPIAILLLMYAGFGMLSVRNLRVTPESSFEKIYALFERKTIPDVPIVIADAHTFMALAHYAPRQLSPRLVYLANPKASLQHLGYDTIDRGALDLKPWFGFQIEQYEGYLEAHPKFFVHASGELLSKLNWLLTELASAPCTVELRAKVDDHLLFLVTSKTNSPSTSSESQP